MSAELVEKIKALLADEAALKERAKAEFARFDANNDGTLTFDEVFKALGDLCNDLQLAIEPDQDEVMDLFRDLDTDSSNALDLAEFEKLVELVFNLRLKSDD